jgi:hypothetical protein
VGDERAHAEFVGQGPWPDGSDIQVSPSGGSVIDYARPVGGFDSKSGEQVTFTRWPVNERPQFRGFQGSNSLAEKRKTIADAPVGAYADRPDGLGGSARVIPARKAAERWAGSALCFGPWV